MHGHDESKMFLTWTRLVQSPSGALVLVSLQALRAFSTQVFGLQAPLWPFCLDQIEQNIACGSCHDCSVSSTLMIKL